MEDGLLWYVFFDPGLVPHDSVRRAELNRIRDDPDLLAVLTAEGMELAASLFHLMFTSGAPVLNRAGEVVAVHIMADDRERLRREDPDCCSLFPTARVLGGGVPADAVRRHLRSALQRDSEHTESLASGFFSNGVAAPLRQGLRALAWCWSGKPATPPAGEWRSNQGINLTPDRRRLDPVLRVGAGYTRGVSLSPPPGR
jgi:hypothetical protein